MRYVGFNVSTIASVAINFVTASDAGLAVVVVVILGMCSGQAAAQSAANPVAAYAYDEGYGTTAADGSISGNTASVVGTSWNTACKFGKCLSFDGVTSFVESPDLDVLTPGIDATFEAWVFLAAEPSETASILNKWGQSNDDEYLFGINPGRKLYFAWHTTGGNAWPSAAYNNLNSAGTIPLNALTHLAVVRNGATVRFYINGVLDSSGAAMDTNPFRNGLNTLRIGGQGRGAKNRFLSGRIDEVRLYNRALTQIDIQDDMNTPIGPVSDTTSPAVSITTPGGGVTVSGTTTVSVTAIDDVGVAGVQLRLDNVAVGAEDLTAPYAMTWNTTTALNGSHTLTAVARDPAGNQTVSAAVSVTVANGEASPASLVAAYGYDEGSGLTSVDASVNSSTATLTGSVWSTACQFGQCLAFHGAGSFVESADLDVLTPETDATFEAWVVLTAAPAETVSVFNKWSQSADDEYLIGINPARTLYFGWHTTGGNTWPSAAFNSMNSVGTIPLNVPTHIAVVRNGAAVRFYINGMLNSSGAVMDTNPFRNGANTLRIGGQGRGAKNRFFTGTIDEARVYNRALSQADIQNDMRTPIGPAAPDTVPPGLSSITVSAVASSAATLTWTTNEPSDAQLEYGLTTAYGSTTALNATLTTSHAIALGGLAPATLYHARVRSRDAGGNLALSADVTLTTLDTIPPAVAITAPTPGAIGGPTTVSATATDNVDVVGVQFRVDGADVGSEDTAAPYAITWETITVANGTHALTAVARDAAGNRTTSPPVSVTVDNDLTPPTIASVTASSITPSAITMSWTTNEASDSQLEYGLTAGYGSTSVLDAGPVTAHSIAVTGLVAASLYHLRVRSRDAAGNLAVSAPVTVATLVDTPPVVSIAAPAAGATLSGTVTVRADATATLVLVGVRFYLDGAPLGTEDILAPYTVSWNTTATADGSHVLTAVARDLLGNQTTSAAIGVTVSNDATPPIVTNVATSSITASGATVSWTTNEASDAQVEYGPTTAYGNTSTLDANLVTSHAITLTGLAAASVYHVRVRSRDAAGNLGVSGDVTLTTIEGAAPVNLVAAYGFDESAGAAAGDASVHHNSAALAGTSWHTGCQFGTCLSFNGTSSVVEAPDLDVLTLGTEGTFEAWVFLTAAPSETVSIVNKWNQSNDDEYLFGINSNRTLYFAWHTTGGNAWPSNAYNHVNGVNAIALNTLTHVALVRSGATLSFYINGALDASSNVADANPFRNGVNTLRIGGQGRGTKNRFLSGRIDEVRLYNRALTLIDIQNDLNTPIGPAAPDTTPPGLSSIAVSSVTASGATITWTTNEPADSRVNYGVTTGYGNSSALDVNLVTSHTVTLSGLTPATLYHARVRSRDAALNLALSGDITFTTLDATPDITPPTVTIATPLANATVSGTTTVTATATDNVGVAGVRFYLDGAPLGAEDTTNDYAVTWNTTTAANGTHVLTAVARDAAGNATTSAAVVVTAANDTTAPSITGVAASSITSSTATITWNTDEASDSQVEYGPTTAYGSASALDANRVTSHAITVSGLNSGLVYHARVRSRDAAGNLAVSGDLEVTTLDSTPPVVSITTPAGNATVSGTVTAAANATDDLGVSGVQFKLNGALLGAEDLVAPYTVAWNTTAVANGTHTLTAVARDAAGNVSSSAVTVTVDNNAQAELVAAYSYNDGAGTTAADASVNNNTATVVAATWSTACKFGKCLSFNGATGFAESADIAALTLATEATFEGWVRLSSAPAETASIFNKWSQTADDEYLIGINSARALVFAWQTTGGGSWPSPSFNEAASAGTIPLNTLTHIAVVRSGTTLAFYINGMLDSSLSVLDTNPFHNGVNTLRVGGQGRGGRNRFFPGVIDEARIYKRALTQAEIQADMTTTIGPDTTPPVLSAISVSGLSSSSATIGWTTNESSDTQVDYGTTTAYGNTTSLLASPVTEHSVILGSLPASTLHHYRVRSRDAAGNLTVSGDHTFTTPAVDSAPPTVSLTAPGANSMVSGVVTVSANAADNVGVVRVQFKLDGQDLGFADTAAPYAITWDTTATSNGAHTLTAVAWDAAGNSRSSTTITVTVSNAVVTLEWDANTEANLAGYKVYVGDASGVYTRSFDVGNTTSYTVTGLQAGRLYYFAVIAYDQSMKESGFSDEVSTTTP